MSVNEWLIRILYLHSETITSEFRHSALVPVSPPQCVGMFPKYAYLFSVSHVCCDIPVCDVSIAIPASLVTRTLKMSCKSKHQ